MKGGAKTALLLAVALVPLAASRALAQRCAAQNGQYSAPMYSTSGLPPEVSGAPLTVAKYDPSCDALLTAAAFGAGGGRRVI